MPDIQLNFINNSNDVNNSSVVIFQKNVASDVGELATAWLVIKNCGQGNNHPFIYPEVTTVGTSDAWGNYTPQLPAMFGQQFSLVRSPSGDSLTQTGASASPAELEILNNLSQGAINAGVYKNGALLLHATSISPQQKAVFQFKPTIWIGVVSQVERGQLMNSAILSSIDTEISLLGVASADIVMTGGGSGTSAEPFTFSLENVVMS